MRKGTALRARYAGFGGVKETPVHARAKRVHIALSKAKHIAPSKARHIALSGAKHIAPSGARHT